MNKKLLRQLTKRDIKVEVNEWYHQYLIRYKRLSKETNGWFWYVNPKTIYIVKGRLSTYKSDDITRTILHEYYHCWQLHHKPNLYWMGNRALTENNARRFAERAKRYFN